MSWMARILIGIGVLIIALPFYIFIDGTIRTWSAGSWPVAQGRVTAGRIATTTGTDSDGDPTTSHDVVVTFDYPVAGRRSRSERLYLNTPASFSDLGDARAELASYPVGAPLEVSYNPDNPQDAAVFIEGPSPFVFLIAIFGIGFALAGYLLHKTDGPMRPLPKVRFNRSRK